ncbi:MAG: metal-dependent hydrolase [Gammaproteobacteria bacterium]|nr:metal-dependent hydrolase [Gammaproteobacteria bacterium]
MHPITVRKMQFDIPTVDNFNPKWAADNIMLSYLATGTSLYVAYLEPFLVKSLRRVLDQVKDEELRENVDRFCRQEAQHYMQHERFNAAILEFGYPGLRERFDRLKGDFEHFLAAKGDKWCVGFVEGFEAYTTQSALKAFSSRLFEHPRTDKRFGALFEWHLAEEIEHRNVAFDIYQHLYGDKLFRAKLCYIAQMHIWRFTLDCMKIMSPVDTARFDDSYRVKPLDRALATVAVIPMFVKTYLPWYTPHAYSVPDNIQQLSESLTEAAESIS